MLSFLIKQTVLICADLFKCELLQRIAIAICQLVRTAAQTNFCHNTISSKLENHKVSVFANISRVGDKRFSLFIRTRPPQNEHANLHRMYRVTCGPPGAAQQFVCVWRCRGFETAAFLRPTRRVHSQRALFNPQEITHTLLHRPSVCSHIVCGYALHNSNPLDLRAPRPTLEPCSAITKFITPFLCVNVLYLAYCWQRKQII